MVWDPAQYERFSDHRRRPFADLLSRVGAADPRVVVDLGCGPGPLTLGLAQRWPDARIIGVDSSATMLERARGLDTEGRVEWVEADLAQWHPDCPVDVVIANAALQWVPKHLRLLPRLVQWLVPGGWFAMQVPGNFGAPSHTLLREVAERSPRADELASRLRGASAVAEPTTYLGLLAEAGCSVDAWETTYLHVLDPEGTQEVPVLEWTKGTALRPVFEVLTEESERADFLAAYGDALRAAYPRRAAGTVFPFRRIFAVAQK